MSVMAGYFPVVLRCGTNSVTNIALVGSLGQKVGLSTGTMVGDLWEILEKGKFCKNELFFFAYKLGHVILHSKK